MVASNGGEFGVRYGPVVTRVRRVIEELPRERWEGMVQFNVMLPEHRCRHGLGCCGAKVMSWSIWHLVEPLRAYYAAYVPPMRFGAKPGPKDRRVA